MSHGNSRRWLVKDKSHMKAPQQVRLISTTTHQTQIVQSIVINSHNSRRLSVCRRQTKHKSRLTKQIQPTSAPPPSTALAVPTKVTNGGGGRRVNNKNNRNNNNKSSISSRSPCLNQIVEVLLAILLANCLIHMVPAELAPPPPRTPMHSRGHARRSSDFDFITANELSYTNSIEDFQTGSAAAALTLHRSENFKISPKPCTIGRIEGTCMFVWECIKSEGRHVGMCVDSFMFGSCCAHNYTDNIVLPQTFSYTRPTKPVGISSFNHRPRPPHMPHKPSISGMTTIERPHGAGTLVIRPSGPVHQGPMKHKPFKQQSATLMPTATTVSMASTDNGHPPWSSNDLQASASISSSAVTSSNTWPSSPLVHQHQHWQMTTEPNFITKPRPPSWEKPTPLRPSKPSKPTKKPTASTVHYQPTLQQTPPSTSIVYSTRRPMPVPTPSKHRPQQPHQQPQETLSQAQQLQHIRPSAAAGTTTLRPSTPVAWLPHGNGSNSSSSSTSIITTTTSHHHRPTTLAPSNSHWASASTLSTLRPTAASQSSTQSLDATTMIESNEILDSDGIGTIKTISAARSECGVPLLARAETRIVGGKSAPFGRWPWQVSVRRTSFFGFSSTHRCGGALINENWIATAGHCVDDLLKTQIRIRVGEYDFSHVQEQLPYIERSVADKVVHPKYNFFTYEYDLALVKLEQPLEFAPHVSPICLPQTDSLLIGMNATVTGWGRLSEGGTLPSVLQEVAVPIVSNDNCKTMFLRAGRQEFIPEIFLCAGYETGGQDSCQGDSGGPLQVKSQDGRFFLAGIISWGIGCAEANLPGVCTRISKFVPWILENVKSET